MIADNNRKGEEFSKEEDPSRCRARPLLEITSGFEFPVGYEDEVLDENLIVCVMVNKYQIIKKRGVGWLVRWGSWEGFPSDTWSLGVLSFIFRNDGQLHSTKLTGAF